MIPYYKTEGQGLESVFTDETGKRSIGLAPRDSRICQDFDIEIDIRGRRQPAKVVGYHIRQDAAPLCPPDPSRCEDRNGFSQHRFLS